MAARLVQLPLARIGGHQLIASYLRDLCATSANVLAEIVFPPTCAGCNSNGSWMCEMCAEQLDAIDRISELDGAAWTLGVQLRARFAYADPVRRAVHLLKYEGQRARAVWFGEQLMPLLQHINLKMPLLQPVPLTARRERTRGFNQSHEIAISLSNLSGVPVGSSLQRIRETQPQVNLSGPDRIANVRGAFAADTVVSGRQVLLVDDVITTGATMRECAAACLEAGAESVIGLAAATG